MLLDVCVDSAAVTMTTTIIRSRNDRIGFSVAVLWERDIKIQ